MWRMPGKVDQAEFLRSSLVFALIGHYMEIYRQLAGQSGRYALASQAHVQTLFPNFDEPEPEVVLTHALAFTCTLQTHQGILP